MGEHATLAPSAAHRWLNCPGSVALCAPLPDTDSVHTREGDFAHAIAAEVLERDLDRVAELIGTTNGEFTCDAVMAEHVEEFVSTVRARVMLTGGHLMVEQKVTLTEDNWGTSDAIVFSEAVVDVMDLKYGQGVYVSVERNEQLMDYAAAVLNTFPELIDEYRVEQVVLHIVQPRNTGAEGEAHRTFTISIEELDAWVQNTLLPGMAATRRPDAPFVEGDWCGFCDGKASCPKLHEQSLALAQSTFDNIEPPSPANMSSEDLALVVKKLDLLRAWIKAVEEHAEHRAKQGEKLPGLKLVQAYGNRAWRDEAEAVETIRRHGGEPYVPKMRSPNQIEKAMGAAGKALTKMLAYKPARDITLVAEADKRPAIAATTNVFEDLGGEQ